MNNGVYLLLGSNLGDRIDNLLLARNFIKDFSSIITTSSIYQTQAWGNTHQPDFLNQIIEVSYNSSPHQLLVNVLTIENNMGRLRSEKWGPRIIDIDILFFGQIVVTDKNLKIPHPEIANRRFTLLPLEEIAPEFIHPVLGKTNKQMLTECADHSSVEMLRSDSSISKS
jgi:2-amino-4-hydroxy-6-hydroxymethyldihydropteridine diphosphokinase